MKTAFINFLQAYFQNHESFVHSIIQVLYILILGHTSSDYILTGQLHGLFFSLYCLISLTRGMIG